MKLSLVPAIAELQEEVGPGVCPFCEDPLPSEIGETGIHCNAPDCLKSYHRLYRTLRTERNWAAGKNSDGAPRQRPIVPKHREDTT